MDRVLSSPTPRPQDDLEVKQAGCRITISTNLGTTDKLVTQEKVQQMLPQYAGFLDQLKILSDQDKKAARLAVFAVHKSFYCLNIFLYFL